MNNEQENKLEQRIRFVAKHYEEGRLDTDKAWQQFAAKHQVRRTVSFHRYWMAAASVLLLLIGFGTYYITDRNSPEWVAITTIPGQIKDVYLPDSTLISMAGSSSIRYDAKSYGKERRVVEMKGKAFFKVTRNETRPFSVYTERTEVTVLGTSFQINEQPDGTDVNVMTGKVSFGATGNETDKVILTAGMSASYSMESKGITFEDIYDLYAVRIIFDPLPGVDEKNMCWDIYSAITDIYRIRPDRIRDWVSRPKANGYQALHLTVMGPDGQWVEIQIRSRRMDDIAEKGFAAHWKYKESNVEEDTELDKWIQTITEILESPDPNALDFLDTIKLNLFTSEIFVFTPKGDIKTLPQGATALDFAYALHSDIGNKCIGAKVNHRLVPLSGFVAANEKTPMIPRIGLRMQMPETFTTLTYYGRGPEENYRDRRTSQFFGEYSLPIKDMYEPYIRPQENNHRTDIYWCAFTNKSGAGLLLVADRTFELNASNHPLETLDSGDDLHNAAPRTAETDHRHLTDPKPEKVVDVFVDYRMMGIGGDNSWGALPHEPYLIRTGSGNAIEYGFTLVPFGRKVDFRNLIYQY